MKTKKIVFNKKVLIGIMLSMIPILIVCGIIVARNIITPTNEEIVEHLKNIKMYSCDVEYTFKNSKEETSEKTKQYYRFDKGCRIEFDDYYKRVKVYNGSEIKVTEDNYEYTLNKNMDLVYPLAFIENVLCNEVFTPVYEIQEEWGEGEYLQVNIKYNDKNKHLYRAEFYIDKKNEVPVLLKILDKDDKERIVIKYNNFKYEKLISESLF